MVSATEPTPRRAAVRSGTRAFYVAMGVLCAAIALIGFSQRYLIPLTQGAANETAIVHIHGVVMFGWIAMLIIQTALVAAGRTSLHRTVGLAGVALGTLVVFTSVQIGVLQMVRELETGRPPLPREFFIFPLANALLVLGLFIAGFANVNRPETHKRLMLMATFVILTPAFSRIAQMIINVFPPNRIHTANLGALATDVLIAIAIAYDWRTRGRPHPAYLIAGACVVAVQALRMTVYPTSWWVGVADRFAALAGYP